MSLRQQSGVLRLIVDELAKTLQENQLKYSVHVVMRIALDVKEPLITQ